MSGRTDRARKLHRRSAVRPGFRGRRPVVAGPLGLGPLWRFLATSCWFYATHCLAAAAGAEEGAPADYGREIRPILAENCFGCHGPDPADRAADLRLDVPPGVEGQASSPAPIVPGRPDLSTLVARIDAEDPAEAMPPPETRKRLTESQKALLRRWIAEGARYQEHWAYVPPERPQPPTVVRTAWPRNPIDHFVLARLEQEGWEPSPEADRLTLLRRVTLDLVGLPPTRAEAEAFLHDESPDAYDRAVDRLLASPSYGERMAADWLDAARYADTNGYQVDRDREQYAYRDWVIDAFNRNLPFDAFTVEQLAGDLLPEPTRAQRIATGFHRNHMMNEEGGAIPEEFLAEYAADRVETTATVWLGQTFNCARCHDHKFDPFTQRDFYSLKAFFHNVSEQGVANYGQPIRVNNPPFLRLTTPEQDAELAAIEQRVAAAETRLRERQAAPGAAETPGSTATAPVGDGEPPRAESLQQASDELARLQQELVEFRNGIPTALVMEELPEPRPTYILQRGAYDRPGAAVRAETPGVLPPMAADLPRNRLGLARWLVHGGHPLTARVTVNRFWQALFGTGIVATSDDFGMQGAFPSHPELLDWLAVEFQESGWDVKRMIKLLVTSAAYRQSSRCSAELRKLDPENRLLARGPRFRLAAEAIRDQALFASGLLVAKLGGPSVKPYHPSGLYEQVSVDREYVAGTGDDLHRRSLYTYWKRSIPHPSMLAFDAPFRETCTVRRIRTNTPMQALALMNDPAYVEAARHLAARMLREGGRDDAGRLAHGSWLVLGRPPREAELEVLGAAVRQFRADYAAALDAARALLAIGVPVPAEGIAAEAEASELAAYALAASLLLCRDEAIMKN